MDRSKGVSSGNSSNIGDRNAAFSVYCRPDQKKDGVAAGDDSAEISIFEAQKYFNETIIDPPKVSNNNTNNNVAISINNRAMSHPLANNVIVDNIEQLSRFSWASSSVHDEYSSINTGRNNLRARSFHAAATPTASSEASWNSQTGLLSHRPGTVAVSLRSPTHHHDHKKISRGMAPSLSSSSSSPRLRWFSFPRRCPCSGKKSVRVEEKMSSQQQAKTSPSHFTEVAAAPRSISLDLRNQTPKSKPVVTARDDQHVIWDVERRRRWEEQMTVKIPSAGNPYNGLFRPHPAAAELQAQHTNAFSFPILKLNGRGSTWSTSLELQQQQRQQQPITIKQEPTLVTLNTSNIEEQSSTTISIQKPTIITSTDHSSTGFTFPASPKSRVIMNNDDDLGSDASSDLFEIESFSTSTQTTATANNSYPSVLYHQYNNNYRRDSMEDDAPSFNAIRGLYPRRRSSLDIEPMTPSSVEYCYEPSEASIDWSVTTAEGLDRPSTASEADYRQEELDRMSRRRSSSTGSYGLLSCRWEKAVSVGPNPVRLVSSVPAATDEVMKHVGSRPPLPNKPRCSHLSIPFATSFHS